MRIKIWKLFSTTLILFISLNAMGAYYKIIDFKVLDIQKISRFTQDRIVFQHIQEKHKEYEFEKTDNSIASLLIIKDKRMYLFKDGYDNYKDVKNQKLILDMENKLIPDLWFNKIDNEPDMVKITDRRVEILKKFIPKDKDKGKTENNLSSEYANVYREVKEKFIDRHAKIFSALMLDREEAGLYVTKVPIPKRLAYQGKTLYATSVSGKTIDGTVYFAEDADGDGLTETFSVSLPDGFNWGFKSGPNILLIYRCQYGTKEKPENESIKKLISHLTREAYFGTKVEEADIKRTLSKEFTTGKDDKAGKNSIDRMIKNLYRSNALKKRDAMNKEHK